MTRDPGSQGHFIADRYQLRRQIGAGGVGQVWLAYDEELGRDVAVKLLRPNLAHAELARKRFEREARVAARLRHPGAVRIFDFGEQDGVLYLVMEVAAGAPLSDFVRDGGIRDLRFVVDVTHQVADTLVAAHQAGLVHRDLKPDNILVSEDGGKVSVTLVDFGMAFLVTGEDLGRMTADGRVAGTPAYMAPEQATGQEIGPAADVYALGCTLFEMLTGTVLFSDAETAAEMATKQVFSAPPRARNRRPDTPSVLDELVDRCLMKSPADRPAAEAICRRLAVYDPEAAPKRERTSFISDRESRMLPAAEATAKKRAGPVHVAFLGTIDDLLATQLVAEGIALVDFEDVEDVDVIYVPVEQATERPGALELGPPVVVELEAEEVGELTSLVRAGVAEVVVRPCGPSKLARCLRRAARRRR